MPELNIGKQTRSGSVRYKGAKARLLKSLPLLFAPVLILSSCAKDVTPQAADLSTQLPATEDLPTLVASTATTNWEQVRSYRAQLTITTSSDRTSIRLREGIWHSLAVISASEQAVIGEVSPELIELGQPRSQAETGGQVQLVVEGYFAELERGDTLLLEIERGYLGSTQVLLSSLEEQIPLEIATLTWGGISEGNQNSQVFEVSADPFLGSAPNEYIVIGQMNFWYFGPGPYGGFEDAEGNRVTPVDPLLGKYWSDDPAVVEQQIEWAVEYGVDAFSVEWDSPNDESLGYPMEKTMDEVFLVAPNIHKIRWLIFYDFNLRMFYFEDQGYDITKCPNFNQDIVHETFVNDFVHFATKYFDHPQYLEIDDRPVVYIWATHCFSGDMASAMQEARQRVAEMGYDVYIVGDEVCYGCLNRAKASLFDATSTFTFLIPGVNQPALRDVGDAARTTDIAFSWWREKIATLKVAGREAIVNFQPGWAPQYDERYSIPDNPIYVPAASKEQVIQMAEVARKHAQPAGQAGMNFVWLNTWNNWGETTTVEPTIDQGPKYPAGNYGFDMLEVVREVFGSETFYTSPGP